MKSSNNLFVEAELNRDISNSLENMHISKEHCTEADRPSPDLFIIGICRSECNLSFLIHVFCWGTLNSFLIYI